MYVLSTFFKWLSFVCDNSDALRHLCAGQRRGECRGLGNFNNKPSAIERANSVTLDARVAKYND